jgi:hypothetical protein
LIDTCRLKNVHSYFKKEKKKREMRFAADQIFLVFFHIKNSPLASNKWVKEMGDVSSRGGSQEIVRLMTTT